MPQFDDKHVKICGCFVVWDGITRPDTGPDQKPKYSLKVVTPSNNPDIQLFNQLAGQALMESKWKGQLPAGARMPIGQAQPHEFNGLYNGFAVLNCNSQRLPDVYDEQGQRLDPMQYGNLLYGGQQVDVLVHCYEYDKAGNKGIATGLDGFAILVSANAQRQNFGGAGIDTAGAFGGGGSGPAAPAQQPYGQPPAQAGFVPQQMPAAQPMAYGQPPAQAGFDPNANTGAPNAYAPQGAPAGNPNPTVQNAGATTYPSNPAAYGQPPAQAGAPVQQQPQQAHNFLPGQ